MKNIAILLEWNLWILNFSAYERFSHKKICPQELKTKIINSGLKQNLIIASGHFMMILTHENLIYLLTQSMHVFSGICYINDLYHSKSLKEKYVYLFKRRKNISFFPLTRKLIPVLDLFLFNQTQHFLLQLLNFITFMSTYCLSGLFYHICFKVNLVLSRSFLILVLAVHC